MKAPKQNSNALSAREARGLPEGNGTPADARMKTVLSSVECEVADAGDPARDMHLMQRRQRPRLRKCSGRGPIPMKRAGICRRTGNHFSRRNTNGNEFLRSEV